MGLSVDEMSQITIGQALDFMAEYVDNHTTNGNEESTIRKASQSDFDTF